MINLFKAFAAQNNTDDFSYEGAFIGKVQYNKLKPLCHSTTYKKNFLKQTKKLCIIDCNGYDAANQLVEKLTAYLIMNVKTDNSKIPEQVNDCGEFWRIFSKEEIADFSHTVGDTNSIHLTNNPVVQGMFILKEIQNKTLSNDIEIKFKYPVYGDNPVYLKNEKSMLQGYSKNALCFVVKYF